MTRPGKHFRHQRGATRVAAIFLLVVIAGVAVLTLRLTLLQQQTVSSSMRASQALHAARSGIAWAAHRAMAGGWCASATLTLTEAGAAGFAVDVNCSHSAHSEAGSTIDVYVIDALAQSGTYGTPDYVSRRLQAKYMEES